LWSEIVRLAGELRPRFLVVENVSALLGRGLSTVLGDLAEIGFDAEWNCIPASAVGAPHRRDRFWLVAYPHASKRGKIGQARERVAWAECLSQWQEGAGGFEPSCQAVADADRIRELQSEGRVQEQRGWTGDRGEDVSDPNGQGLEIVIHGQAGEFQPALGACQWAVEPDVGRMAYGVPSRVDRLKGLGNAVVPQIPELIGHAILEAERAAA
jgi:DNA (cytosine-5)-methyltransferase 1